MHSRIAISVWAVIVLVAAVTAFGCEQPAPSDGQDKAAADPSAARHAKAMTNADIRWDGQTLGLTAQVKGEPARKLLKIGQPATDALRASLDDANKFAAAHVVLTRIHIESPRITAGEWNGLRVKLLADGTTQIDPAQRAALKKYWHSQLADG